MVLQSHSRSKSCLLALRKLCWYVCISLAVVSPMVRLVTVWSVCWLVCWPKMDFLIYGWQFDFEKWRPSWCGNWELALVLSYGSRCLEKPHRLSYASFYTVKNSRQWQYPPSWGCEVIVCAGISVCEEAVFVDMCYWSKLSHMQWPLLNGQVNCALHFGVLYLASFC